MPKAKPATRAAATHFVVERLNWRRAHGDRYFRYPGRTRVASFDTLEAAEAYRRENEAKARAVVNPFAGTLVPPTEQTSLPDDVFCDWLTDQGAKPPTKLKKTGRRDWAAWWSKNASKWKSQQLEAVWDRLDRVSFFSISERPKRPVVYAVVRVVWGYNDEWYYPGSEGGETQTVYRSPERAEQIAMQQNEDARDEWQTAFQEFDVGYAPAGLNQFDMEERLQPGQDPFAPPVEHVTVDTEGDEWHTLSPAQVAFYEVVELELEGQP